MESPVDKGQQMISTKPYKPRADVTVSTSPDSMGPPSPRDYWDHPPASPHDMDSPEYAEFMASKGHKVVPFPYKVAKALAPDIYRNVELDAWIEAKKDLTLNGEIDEQEPTFAPGDKCQVTLEDYPDRVFNAHIQEIVPDHGPTTVFVEELGEKHKVPQSNLRTLPQLAKQTWNSIDDGQAAKKRKGRKKDLHMVIGFNLPPRMQQHQCDESGDHGPHSPASSTGRPRSYSEGAATSGSPVPSQNDLGAGCPGAESGELIQPRIHTPTQSEIRNPDLRPESYGSAACMPVPSVKMIAEAPPPQMHPPQPMAASAAPVPVYHMGPVQVVSHGDGQPPINFGANHSCDPNGSDLPYNDIQTLRYFYNLGIEYHRMSYGMPQPMPQAPQPAVAAPPVQYPVYQTNSQVTYGPVMPTYQLTTMPNGELIQQSQRPFTEEEYPGQSSSGADNNSKVVKDPSPVYGAATAQACPRVPVPYMLGMPPPLPPTSGMYRKSQVPPPPPTHRVPFCTTQTSLSTRVPPSGESGKNEVASGVPPSDKEKHNESTDSCDCPSEDSDKLGVNDSGCVSDASSGRGDAVTPGISDSDAPPSSDVSVGGDKSRNTESSGHESSESQASDIYQDEELLELLRQPVYTRPSRNKNKQKNGTTKLVRPIKDIPPRFKKLLEAEACAQAAALRKNQFEGAPLVRQTMMGRGRRHRNYDSNKFVPTLDHTQVNFNPNAQCFVPGQPYSCPTTEGSVDANGLPFPPTETSSGSVTSDSDTYVNTCGSVVSTTSTETGGESTSVAPVATTTTTTAPPLYTVHVVPASQSSACTVGDGFYCECSNSGVCVPSTGAYPSQPQPPPPPQQQHPVPPQGPLVPQGTMYYQYVGPAPQQQTQAGQGPPPPPVPAPGPGPQPYM